MMFGFLRADNQVVLSRGLSEGNFFTGFAGFTGTFAVFRTGNQHQIQLSRQDGCRCAIDDDLVLISTE